ncbi:ENR1 protein, partial [Centropus unirufus]|nr:ENR1 protein [Centropus unirufus]
KMAEWDLPTLGNNLFVDFMQRINKELNVSNCWICGGSQMTEQWPWRGEGISPHQLLEWNWTHESQEKRPEGWVLTEEVIGQYYIAREG